MDWRRPSALGPTPTNAEVIAKAIELAAAAGKRGRHTEFVVKARRASARRPRDRRPSQSLSRSRGKGRCEKRRRRRRPHPGRS